MSGPIFISYSHGDVGWVRPLADALKREHVVFFDAYELAVGESIPERVRKAIEHADLAVVCRSPAADQRPWLMTERAALQRAGVKILDVQPTTTEGELLALVAAQYESKNVGARPFVLATAADAARAGGLERDLGAEYVPDLGRALEAFARWVGEERPIIVVWSRAARADDAFNRALSTMLGTEIPKGLGRMFVLRLDDAPSHVLLAHALEADSEQALYGRLERQVREARPYRTVPRAKIAARYAQTLAFQRRLLLLGPRRGGVRTLAREVAEKAGFGERVTWLRPPTASGSLADYYQWLIRGSEADASVGTPIEYSRWQLARAGKDPHLIVLLHDGGDEQHFESLANALRGLVEQTTTLSILAAGEARAAELRFRQLDSSLFSGMPTEHVPDLEASDVRQVLAHSGESVDLAYPVWLATGGHPGLLKELVGEPGGLQEEDATQRLAKSPQVAGILRRRLNEDSARRRQRTHAREVLRALVAGHEVEKLDAIQDDLTRPEVRLYYDGLLRADRNGRTEFRCDAAKRAAQEVLRVWNEDGS